MSFLSAHNDCDNFIAIIEACEIHFNHTRNVNEKYLSVGPYFDLLFHHSFVTVRLSFQMSIRPNPKG